MPEKLVYPKKYITKKDVMKQKKKFKFPKAWTFKSTPRTYTLTFSPKKARKYYMVKK